MNAARFQEISSRYAELKIAVVGDFCLDRYLEIDPARAEISIETGLTVHNVVNVRSQPGAAGTILNNLVALGVGEIYPVGFCGVDGEGFELRRSLLARRGVNLDGFVETSERRTFTYCKPLILAPGKPPQELNRLDSKNWTPTPPAIEAQLSQHIERLARVVDAIIVMDQVDVAGTGVVTARVLEAVRMASDARSRLFIIADSRRGLRGFPPFCFKMNAAELAAFTGTPADASPAALQKTAAALAAQQKRPVFVTLAERGIIGADADGAVVHVPSLPVRGEIDIVGAGDSVTANLTTALAAGATVGEACHAAMAAASIVVHQLGTTGTASPADITKLLPAC
jgi:rfaE bifunctional protein kinase chain/domain